MVLDPLLPMAEKSEDALETQPRRRPLTSFWDSAQVYLCILLHTLLILVHVALVVVISHRYEHRVTVETGDPANHLSTIVTAVSQTIGTVFSAVLVLLTQRLALRNDFHIRQTLSELHDKSNAWLGLGSSVVVLWSQLTVRTAPIRILLIAVYLAGIFVFHITTPSLFNVVPFNVTTTFIQSTQLGRVSPVSGNTNVNNQDSLFPEAVYSILEILPLYPNLDTPGLLNSTLYDVIPLLEDAVGEVTVNATQFAVDCGAVPNGSIGGITLNPDDPLSSDSWTMPSIGDPSAHANSIPVANPSLTTTIIQFDDDIYPVFMVSATVNVTDDSGSVQSLHPINPWTVKAANDTSILFDQMQLLVCDVSLKDAAVQISAATGKLAQEPFNETQAEWHNWQRPDSTSDPLLSTIWRIPGDTPSGDQQFCLYVQSTSSLPQAQETCYSSSLFETFLQIYLTPHPTSQPAVPNAIDQLKSDPLLTGNVTLTKLNKVLANAFAAVYWYAGNVDSDRLPGESGQAITEKRTGEVAIQTQSIRSHLNLNAAPLYIGLSVSVLLLLLSVILIGHIRQPQLQPELDTTGLLQLTWLVGQEPAIAERTANVVDPTQDNLRRAGLFEVNLGEDAAQGLAHRKVAMAELVRDE